MSWYSTGTVTGTTSSNIITGVGTNFVGGASVGDLFTIDKQRFYEITGITDASHLTLAENLAANATGAGFSIVPLGLVSITTSGLANKVSDLLVRWQSREAEYVAWSGGSATGGYDVNGVPGSGAAYGYYPLTDAIGVTSYVACPAKQQSFLAADTLDTFHASQTPAASQIPALGADKALTLPAAGFVRGDFSNATPASRTIIQTSSANATTLLTVVPSGSGVVAGIDLYGASTASNCEALDIRVDPANTRAYINSKKVGSGTARYLAFLIDGAEAARCTTSGTFAVGGAAGASTIGLQMSKTIASAACSGIQSILQQSTSGGDTFGADLRAYAVHTSGSSTNVYGLRTVSRATGTGGTVTNLIGINSQVDVQNSPTVTNAIGLQIGDIAIAGATLIKGIDSNISTGTGKWNIYAAGTAASYLAGNLQIGSTTPSAGAEKLQVTGAISATTKLTVLSMAGGVTTEGLALNTAPGGGFLIHAADTTANPVWNIRSNSSEPIALMPGGVESVRLAASGRTLFGTTAENTGVGAARIQSVDGIYLGNSANSAANVLDWYEEATFTATATGMTTSPTGTVSFTRVGNVVTMNLPAISGTSNATTFTLTGGPTVIRPTTSKVVYVRVQDNGTYKSGLASIGTDGVITLINTDPASASWTNSGTKSVQPVSFSYTL